jgi:hypothetical protein
MINIVGKIMLPDIPHGCQDEYAAIRSVDRARGKTLVFTGISGQGRPLAARVNLNTCGRAVSARSVKREKATHV